MNIAEMRAKRAEHLAKMKALNDKSMADNRDLTEAEQNEFDTAKKEAESLAKRIERAEEVERDQAALAKTVNTAVADTRNTDGSLKVPARALSGAIHKTNFKGPNALENGYKSGMWLLGTLYGSGKAAQWCREHGVVVERAASEGVNTAGGYLVPDEFENTIIDLRETYGVARQLARRVPMLRDTKSLPRRDGGLTAYAVGEGAAITESQKTWSNINLTARKWGTLTRYSSELSEDAIINMASDLAGESAYAFTVAEDDAFFNGDGTSTYHGIVGIRTKMVAVLGSGQLAGAVDLASGHDTFAEIDATDLANVMAKLPQYALGNAAFVCSQVAFSLVFERLAQAVGGLTKAEFAGRTLPSYQGYPVIISQKMPVSTSDISDTAMLFFGDFSLSSAFGDRRGMTMLVSDQRYLEYDQIGIMCTERFDINHHSVGDSTTAGPVVAAIAE